jgi:hypothetical protein
MTIPRMYQRARRRVRKERWSLSMLADGLVIFTCWRYTPSPDGF